MEKKEKIKITIINRRNYDRKRTSISRWFAKPAAGTIKSILSGLIAAGLFSFVLYAFALPPDSKYDPGYTLTPDCIPGGTNCTVVAPAVYSFAANNFSGTGGFTTTGTITAGTLKVGSVYTFPTADGTNGQVLTTNGSGTITWGAGGSGTPGGLDTQVQYNSSGSFAGSANLTFSGTVLTAANIIDSGLTASKAVFTDGSKQLTSTGILGLDQGGTAANLTANNGGIVYSNATTLAILNGTATANQILMSGLSTTPAWSTAIYPATTTINQLLYSSSGNTVGGLTTGNSGVLVTGVTGIPSIAIDIPTAVTIGGKYIYRADGTDVPVADGGTGLSAMVAYAVLAGGTTTTGALQQVSGLGTSGQVLTSNGAAALPTWQAAGTGTVTGSGANTRVAYWSDTSVLTSSANYTYTGTLLTVSGTGNGGYINITDEANGYQVDGLRVITNKGSTGTENLFLGQSGNFTTTGTKNIFAGYQAGLAITTGYGNQFIGYQAGYSTTTGSNDVFLGEQAGYTNITGVANVFLGYQAGYYETGSNKLFIDNQQRTSEADARTKALVYGVFDAAVANQTLTINGQPYLSVLAVGTGSAGAITADTTTGKLYVASSSLKYKHDIQPLTENWAAILQAQPKSFEYNGSNQPDIGYIAEDFDSLGLKDLVLYDDQGRPNAIKYDRITLYNTEILKQQQIDINTLKQRLGITTDNVAINPAGTVGDGTVLGVTDQTVKQSLANLGATLVNGIMSLKQVLVDNLTAKTADIEQINIQKMQMVDQVTGDIYCTWIENGDWQKSKGECSSIEVAIAVPQETEQLQPSIEEVKQEVKQEVRQELKQELRGTIDITVNEVKEDVRNLQENVEQLSQQQEEVQVKVEEQAQQQQQLQEQQEQIKVTLEEQPTSVLEIINENITETIETVTEDITETIEIIKETVTETIPEAAGSLFNGIKDFFKGIFKQTTKQIAPAGLFFSRIWEFFKGMFK